MTTIHRPKLLAQTTNGNFTPLVEAAKRQRLVLYLGAGISMAPPACGPRGMSVADKLRPFVAQMLDVTDEELGGQGLEDLAQRVAEEAGERLDELRVRAVEVFNFCGIEPNYGHEAAALLLREGLVALYSVNWDCGIERAGTNYGMRIEVLTSNQESVQATDRVTLQKIHGCAEDPPTLALTQAEVDKPKMWAVASTQDALLSGMVVFVGLGTVGLYVREPLTVLLGMWEEGRATVRVADPNLSAQWLAALGEDVEDVHIPCTADEFMDDLLRAVVHDALDLVQIDVRDLDDQESAGWTTTMLDGFLEIRERFMDMPADGVLRWWRDRVINTEDGKPFVTEIFGRHSLMTVAQLAGIDGGEVRVSGTRGRQTVSTARRYFEIVCRPGQHIRSVQEIAEHHIRRRREEGVYGDGLPVSVVVVGATGKFPASQAREDIAVGDADPMDIGEGIEMTRIHVVSAEDGVRGRLAA